MARRSKKQEVPENHERWLITYADLITLLLIFFVIMYAMSKIDVDKYAVLAQALNFEFRKADSVMQQGTSVIGKVDRGEAQEGKTTKKPSEIEAEEQQKKAQQEKELEQLLQKINQYIVDNKLESQVKAENTPKGVAVTLNDLFLFDLGKADLKPAAYPILDKLSSLFLEIHSKVSIEGHTDNIPLNAGSVYRDNWGLSQARSLSVLRYFIYNAKVDQKNLISTAYADTMPVVDNSTEANRAKNRRVEIVVLRDQ